MRTDPLRYTRRVLCTLIIPASFVVDSSGQCTTILPFDNNEHTSSLERYSWKPKAIQQDCRNWCWAAVSESVLKFFKFNIGQSSLATLLFGSDICKAADCQQITTNLNRLVFTLDSPVAAYSCSLRSAASCMVRELSHCKPLIAGLRNPDYRSGHAYVIVAITYEVRNGTSYPNDVVLIDPWPEVKNPRLKMSWTEFQSRLTCLIRFEEQ